MTNKRIILQCPECKGHSDAEVTESGEVFFTCDFCGLFQDYQTIPKTHYGQALLSCHSAKPDFSDYVYLTVRFEEPNVEYYVLSNSEIVWRGTQMIAGCDTYLAIVKAVFGDSQ